VPDGYGGGRVSILQFFDKGHIYMLDGKRLPCVSDLCRFLHREIYRDAPVWQMEAAADRGTKVHAATEALDKTGRAETEDEYLPYLQAYAQFLQEHEVQWELIEHPDYHPAHHYAGTIDRYGMVDGLHTLVDLKTTYTVYKPLCSASLNLYRLMLEARGKPVDRILIIHLKKDGTYKLVPFDFDDSVPMALITLHTALKTRRRK
jgi:hypothetical protein